MLKLIFKSGESVTVTLHDNILTDVYKKMLKHLQHVELEEYPLDNPYRCNKETAVTELLTYAELLGIEIDQSKFVDQQYLNYLHKIYEKTYNRNGKNVHPDRYWMHYQEAVHVVEHTFVENIDYSKPSHTHVDYREKCGPVIRPFDNRYRDLFVTEIPAGTVCIDWTELGKIPYDYWMNREEENLDRVCELVKPWTGIKPKLKIYLNDRDMVADDVEDFLPWFEQYKPQWLKHWGLDSWDIKDQFGRPPIGVLDDLEKFDELLRRKDWVYQVKLK